MNYVDELLNGENIRVTYKRFFEDYTADNSGWSEELYVYDNKLKMCKIFYPISTYDKYFFTLHTMSETEINLRNIDNDEDVLKIKLETSIGDSVNIKDLKTVAQEIFEKLNESQLRFFISQFQS